MAVHLSARLTWHDRGWDGHICNNPGKNSFCEGHETVRDHKNTELENKNAGKSLSDLDKSCMPACESSLQTFCSRKNSVIHFPPSFMIKAKPRLLELESYSTLNWAFEEMWDEDGGHKPQEERLKFIKEFYGEFKENLGHSLVFFYVDERNPVGKETANKLGQRILVGVSRLTGIGDIPIGEWDQKIYGKDENFIMWSVEIRHGFPDEGVRIPYQEYISQKIPIEEIAIPLTGDLRERCKYVGRKIGDDTATILIEKIIGSLRVISKDNLIPGNWNKKIEWLNNILKEVWIERGPYPGVKLVLNYLKFEEGTTFQKEVVNKKAVAGEVDFLELLKKWLEGTEELDDEKYKINIESSKEEWSELSEEEKELLLKFCRFELNGHHIKIIMSDEKRKEHDITSSLSQIAENPYLLCEEYLGSLEDDFINFETIDLGMMPSEFIEIKDKIKNEDRRRVRAMIIERLNKASEEGDTFLSAKEVIDWINKKCPENRKCEIELKKIISEKNKDFYLEKVDIFENEDGTVYFSLKSVRQDEKEIQDRINSMISRDTIEPSRIEWPKILNDEKRELSQEQIDSLERSFRSPLSIITGAAGTGKSTLVSALINGIKKVEGNTGILALTPTGKAADRLKEIGISDAKTIHKGLSQAGWFNWTTLSFKTKGDRKLESENIIIDESSMVDVSLLATLFKAINWNRVKRLIFVGDYHQLPPIGPGRPFYDIIKHLRKSEDKGNKQISELEYNFRIKKGSKVIALAKSFAKEPEYNESDLFKKIALAEELDDLKVVFWEDDSDLYIKVLERLNKLIESEIEDKNKKPYELFNKLLESGAGIWQIISATRQNYFGTGEINKHIQGKFHSGLIKGWKKIKSGNEQITFKDKVIQKVNDKTRTTEFKGQWLKYQPVFNGQIGLSYPNGNKKGLRVLFDRQPNQYFHYNESDVNQMLELAYAITVHKSQGSQFDHVFFVLPQESIKLLSRELVYTGLTRAQKGLTLFLQQDIEPLFKFRSWEESAILDRNSRLFDIYIKEEPRYMKEGLVHVTDKGEKVRSKSEVIIANFLHSNGVDYKYEERLYNKEGDKNDFRIPDFTIYIEGKVWYLEHCGMVNDDEYLKKWENERKPWYKKNNYETHLIITYDKLIGNQGLITENVYATIKSALKLN